MPMGASCTSKISNGKETVRKGNGNARSAITAIPITPFIAASVGTREKAPSFLAGAADGPAFFQEAFEACRSSWKAAMFLGR